MNTAITKRYYVQQLTDDFYVHPVDPRMKRIKLTIWDSIEEKEINLPKYSMDMTPTLNHLKELLKDYCQEINDKYEDDLLYLKEVNNYIDNE